MQSSRVAVARTCARGSVGQGVKAGDELPAHTCEARVPPSISHHTPLLSIPLPTPRPSHPKHRIPPPPSRTHPRNPSHTAPTLEPGVACAPRPAPAASAWRQQSADASATTPEAAQSTTRRPGPAQRHRSTQTPAGVWARALGVWEAQACVFVRVGEDGLIANTAAQTNMLGGGYVLKAGRLPYVSGGKVAACCRREGGRMLQAGRLPYVSGGKVAVCQRRCKGREGQVVRARDSSTELVGMGSTHFIVCAE
eukprot:40847-Chlamydomonas_euryale.AAC.4